MYSHPEKSILNLSLPEHHASSESLLFAQVPV